MGYVDCHPSRWIARPDSFFPLTQIKPEGMSQLYASQPSNPDVSMDDYDEEEEDEDDMEEVME